MRELVMDNETPAQTVNAYEPPRIERVMTGDELEREVLYAGSVITVHLG
jgi:hypothetical protein